MLRGKDEIDGWAVGKISDESWRFADAIRVSPDAYYQNIQVSQTNR